MFKENSLMPCKFYINVWIFVRENACKFCPNECGNIWDANVLIHEMYKSANSCGCRALAGGAQTAAEASKLLAVLGHWQNCKQLPRDSWIFCKPIFQLGH
jgi:hypothetical protein